MWQAYVLYELARGLGMNREDNSDSLFPVQRMPFGLLQYAVGFFNAKTIHQVYSKKKKISVASIPSCIHMQADAASLFSSLF